VLLLEAPANLGMSSAERSIPPEPFFPTHLPGRKQRVPAQQGVRRAGPREGQGKTLAHVPHPRGGEAEFHYHLFGRHDRGLEQRAEAQRPLEVREIRLEPGCVPERLPGALIAPSRMGWFHPGIMRGGVGHERSEG